MQQVQEAHPTYFKLMDLFVMLVADFEESVILVFLLGLKISAAGFTTWNFALNHGRNFPVPAP